jgi:hypothetical protein
MTAIFPSSCPFIGVVFHRWVAKFKRPGTIPDARANGAIAP